MNSRTRIWRVVPVLLLAAFCAAAAAEEVRRMGILFAGRDSQRSALEHTMLETLRNRGFVESRNLIVTRRYAEGDMRRLAAYAKEMEALNPEVVVTMCTPSTRAMSETSATIPIVMGMVTDPVGQQLVASLARPGRNVTGTASVYEEVIPKMLEMLAVIMPKQARVAVLANPANKAHPRIWPIAEEAARLLQITLQRYDVTDPAALSVVLESMLPSRPQAIFTFPDDPMLSSRSVIISEFAMRNRLPTLFSTREHVESGGLLSYGMSFADGYRQAGRYVERVLRGAKPAELPVEQPTHIEVSVNLKTARVLGIVVPQSLLLRADRVIE